MGACVYYHATVESVDANLNPWLILSLLHIMRLCVLKSFHFRTASIYIIDLIKTPLLKQP